VTDVDLDPRFPAAVELLGRCGAEELQVRFCEEEKPTVWMALARWRGHWEVGAALDPLRALFRLCDEVMDGGLCLHCGKPSAFSDGFEVLPDIMGDAVCWYAWDPELKTYRRGCE
jgi:hypothetical protein